VARSQDESEEPVMISSRDAKTEGGNYAENIGGHYIQHANQVVFNSPPVQARPEPTRPSSESNGSTKRLAFVIAGEIDQADQAFLQAILETLQKKAGDTSLALVAVQKGSIKLILSGTPEGLERLQALFEAGELTEVLGTPVEAVQFVEPEIADSNDEKEIVAQSQLVDATKIRGGGQDLRGRDISKTALSSAELTGTNLIAVSLLRELAAVLADMESVKKIYPGLEPEFTALEERIIQIREGMKLIEGQSIDDFNNRINNRNLQK
jgi:hypothetical protein